MRTRMPIALSILLGLTLAAAPAAAQYQPNFRPAADRATGEKYRIELSGGYWNPTPEIVISSEQLGIVGSDIDFVQDLGIAQTRFRDFRLVLRPAEKHKFRIQRTPVRYTAEHTLQRDIIFNGIAYRVGLPVNSDLQWRAWRFGYEYDFIYRDRGFLGLILEAKYTDVEILLDSVIGLEYARARAPIPAIGGIGRVYVVPNISLTFEMTGFKLPERIDEDYRGRYVDYDFYGTVNFSDHFGVQTGYRSLDVMYRVENDAGDLRLAGLYFSGVIRF
jgi:hypothetical protein